LKSSELPIMSPTKAQVRNDGTNSDQVQLFLDGNQYTTNGIKRYQRIFGDDFVSTGGRSTTEKLFALLELNENEKLLDVGCGTGCASHLIAETYKAQVYGVDLSSNMIDEAKQTASQMDPKTAQRLTFNIADVTRFDYHENTFDAIFTKDAMLHIPDKLALFTRFHKWLKPGGRLVITDYCVGSIPKVSDKFTTYLENRGYHLGRVQDYETVLRKAGFTNAVAHDQKDHFRQILKTELDKFQAQKDSFIKDFSESDYNDLVRGWTDKLEFTGNNEMTWAIMTATK